MPRDVSIAWLAGGLAMVAAVLMIAYVVPLPGTALVSFEPLAFLDSPGNTSASRLGWGQEGADKSNPDAPATTDSSSQDKEIQRLTAQKGAPAGDVGDGTRDDGPKGKQKGGDQQSSGGGDQKQSSESDSSSKQENGSKQQSGQQSKQSGSDSSKQQSGQQSDSSSQESSSDSSQDQSDSQPSSESKSDSQSGESQSGESQSGESQSAESQSSDSQSGESKPDSDQQDSANDQQQQQSDGGLPPEGSSGQASSPSSPSVMETMADAVPMIASLFKLIVFLVLAGIVGAFVWMNRHLLAQWWDWLFGRGDSPTDDSFEEFFSASTQVPARTFASFRNPIGKESDLRRIVVITFQAFEAWTREQGIARGRDETPSEFIKRVATSVPQMSAPASQVVDAYNRIVYGRGQATKSDLSAAEQVWKAMLAH